jgi:8-oxo-dGTP pyrophosphatase MutT (NUDIX family)
MHFPNSILTLQNVIHQQLPGESAHIEMIPSRIRSSVVLEKGLNYKESAVSVLLYEENGFLQSVLIERPEYPGVHSGQMAFPGGKKEPEDKDNKATALREMKEEIGFYDENIHYLGLLTPVFIPISEFLVYPHVFYTAKKPIYVRNEREVKSIVPFSIDVLLNPDNLLQKDISIGNGQFLKDMHYFAIEKKVVWGATCLILNELKHCFRKISI